MMNKLTVFLHNNFININDLFINFITVKMYL